MPGVALFQSGHFQVKRACEANQALQEAASFPLSRWMYSFGLGFHVFGRSYML